MLLIYRLATPESIFGINEQSSKAIEIKTFFFEIVTDSSNPLPTCTDREVVDKVGFHAKFILSRGQIIIYNIHIKHQCDQS